MYEFFNECINTANLPITILMGLVLCYWVMVILGVLGLDAIDFDFDGDVDLGVDADGFSGSSLTGNEGIFRALFEFFYLGDVPLVIIGTFFTFYLWIATFITNHYFNPSSSLMLACILLVPNIVLCLLLTRYTMVPFAILFRKAEPDDKTRADMVGKIGRIVSSEVTPTFGELEIARANDTELTLNIRTRKGDKLVKGDAAKIISYNHADGTFLVELSKWENNADD